MSTEITAADSIAAEVAPRRRFRRIAAAVLAGAAIATAGLVSAIPAHAAAGPTTVNVCVNAWTPSLKQNSLVTPNWWNGYGWVAQPAVHTNAYGCASVTMVHNGWWYIRVTDYSLLPCAEYVYGWQTNAFVKQNIANGATLGGTMNYWYSIGLC
jgi:hypothetical protein